MFDSEWMWRFIASVFWSWLVCLQLFWVLGSLVLVLSCRTAAGNISCVPRAALFVFLLICHVGCMRCVISLMPEVEGDKLRSFQYMKMHFNLSLKLITSVEFLFWVIENLQYLPHLAPSNYTSYSRWRWSSAVTILTMMMMMLFLEVHDVNFY